MTLIDALARLAATREPVLHTSDAAAHLGIHHAHASAVLARLAASGHVVRLRRGIWALPGRVDALAIPAHLTYPFPAYVSLQSALYLHRMSSQVPVVTYAVSLARTRRFRTPLGDVSIHHVDPGFYFGDQDVGPHGARMATPEKALVDFLYLGPARSKLFRALPELELPKQFSLLAARSMVDRIQSPRRRAFVARRLAELTVLQKPPRLRRTPSSIP
jgi:predicted transcriptional regulator of viral defense system